MTHQSVVMVTLQLMIATLLAPVGRKRVLQAFEHFKMLSGEFSCYESLVQLLTEEPVNPFLQVFRALTVCILL